MATPALVAQNATWATLNVPVNDGLFSAPDENAKLPAGTVTPRKTQGAGPLHISFCRVASNVVESAVTVLVIWQAVPTFTFCSRLLEKDRYACWAATLYPPEFTIRSSVNWSPTLTEPPLAGPPACGVKKWNAPLQVPGVAVAVGGTGVFVLVAGTGVLVLVGGTGELVAVFVFVGGTGVFVAVFVLVAGTGVLVLVGGTGVLVLVLVGGTGVLVAVLVLVGGTGVLVAVLVGGTGVLVGVLVPPALATFIT